MNSPRAEPPLCDFESPAFSQQQIRRQHAHVLIQNIAMTVRRMVVPEDRQHARNLDAGRVHGDDDHGLLLVLGAADGSVLPMKMATLQRGSPAPELHHLRPLIT